MGVIGIRIFLKILDICICIWGYPKGYSLNHSIPNARFNRLQLPLFTWSRKNIMHLWNYYNESDYLTIVYAAIMLWFVHSYAYNYSFMYVLWYMYYSYGMMCMLWCCINKNITKMPQCLPTHDITEKQYYKENWRYSKYMYVQDDKTMQLIVCARKTLSQ